MRRKTTKPAPKPRMKKWRVGEKCAVIEGGSRRQRTSKIAKVTKSYVQLEDGIKFDLKDNRQINTVGYYRPQITRWDEVAEEQERAEEALDLINAMRLLGANHLRSRSPRLAAALPHLRAAAAAINALDQPTQDITDEEF